MEHLVRWMNGTGGRALRAAMGVALIAAGIAINGPAGAVIGLLGAVALVAGGARVCLLAPLAHLPLRTERRGSDSPA